MAQRNLKARYRTVGPKSEKVTYTKCYIDENGALQQESATEEMECYYVFFPHGHSIRVTSFEKLKELGYHIKPRIVDMDTGDLIDIGGDPYDFSSNDGPYSENLILEEEGDISSSNRSKKRTADATA
jgi:hypothetical protein